MEESIGIKKPSLDLSLRALLAAGLIPNSRYLNT
jgi:hypothetical protein